MHRTFRALTSDRHGGEREEAQKWWEDDDVLRAEPDEKPSSSPGVKFFIHYFLLSIGWSTLEIQGVATLRPETMYGQTNAWVLPDGKLELLKSLKLMCLFLLTEQLLTLITRTIRGFRRDPLACLSSLIGLPLKSPLSFNEGDEDEWVFPFEIVPIIEVPQFGNKCVKTVCLQMKIKKPELIDKEKLAEAKKQTYLKGWPTADAAPDLKLKSSNKYLQRSFRSESWLIREETPDSEQSSVVQSWNFKQKIQFLKFKKEEAIALGAQALDLRLPFGEIEVLKENLDVIKRQIGLEDVEILSAVDADSLARAEPLASLLNQNPPSPGKPTAIFLTR
ncbi:Leucine--tRNA ligase, cytoplasmic [Glycine soja]